MNYLSLYRKYRPRTFKDVVGQEFVVQILKNSIKNNKIANAYVFAGVKGTGKTSIAKIYANAINCLDNKDGDACGKCDICQDFINNQVMDVIELDGASNNGVDEVRKIIDAAVVLPAKLNKKVYIIDEAHMLTPQAWNALLKVVEEPPKHVVFIFATTEMHKIPTTILSRCQCFTFNKITHDDIVRLLKKVCDAEGFKYDLEALNTIADIVDGSARDALSILEQTSTYGDGTIKTQDIYKVFGILSSKQIIDFLNLLPEQNNKQVFAAINQYFSTGINFVNFCNLLVAIITDKLVYLKTKDYSLLTRTNETTINELAINDLNKLMKLLDIWQETYFRVSVPTDIKVIIEHALMQSIALFSNEEIVVEQPVVKPVVKKVIVEQPKVEEVKKEEKSNISIDDCFSVKLRKVKEVQPKVEEVKKVVDESLMPSDFEILLVAASNKEAKYLKDATELLKQIKSGDIDKKEFSDIKLASKVLFASENCIVLLFDDELDAKLLNKTAKTGRFILECCTYFRNPKYVVGFTAAQINKHKAEIQAAMKSKKAKLSLQPLRKVLNTNPSVAQVAFNTIYSKLEEKDRK